MATVPYDHTITDMLQNSAELIALKPKEEQVEWVQFLLSEMKSLLSQQDYADLLTGIQEGIGKDSV